MDDCRTRDTETLMLRASVTSRQRTLRAAQVKASRELQHLPPESPDKHRLFQAIQDSSNEHAELQGLLDSAFLPAHSARQLISPRSFFASPLFRVGSKKAAREKVLSVQLKNNAGDTIFTYTGPELRQSDGLVFMGLLALARDTKLGAPVSFSVEEFCQQIYGRYDGPTRNLLKEHIRRLQRGLVEFDKFSVQLCLRFEHDPRGPWAVTLDADIVQLFQRSPEVWLERSRRKQISEGLASWLYGYIEAQSKLIPTSVERLHALCGSDASMESFVRMVRVALHELERNEVIDAGWSVKQGLVHWMKRRTAVTPHVE